MAPSGVILALTDNPDCEDLIWPNPWGGAIIQLHVDEFASATMDRLRQTAKAVGPDLVTLKPSLLPTLEKLNQVSKTQLACPVLVSGAEFARRTKDATRRALVGPVVEAYGLTETGLIAADCPCGSGLRVDPDVIVEVLDEDNTPVPSGEVGQIVVTSLRNKVLPLLRYATGDLARVAGNERACGLGLHLIELMGRTLRPFRDAEGRLVPPARFHALFKAFPIAEFQLTEIAPGIWRLTVEPCPGTRIATRDLRDWVCSRAGVKVDVDVIFQTIETHGGKFQRYRVLD